MTTPLMIKLENKQCVVVGGGKVATRKVRFLLGEKAAVTVISHTLSEELQLIQRQFNYIDKRIDQRELLVQQEIPTPCFLAVIATDNRELNHSLANELKKSVPLINVVDNQPVSNFFFPAYIKRGLLKIAVSTSGASPILARKIKRHLEDQFGNNYVSYLEQLRKEREFALNSFDTEKERKDYLENITKLL
ncbi:MAG: bifunctional precorrin-2 dehydrogenase/sirohydrochlorin ferrochelatase [Bacillaceae bacterium]|nr:bifunctional precorrin-2 dehydrogenase/sirohydrochlorin ferrochelatase [Bacillaceae bacterium]